MASLPLSLAFAPLLLLAALGQSPESCGASDCQEGGAGTVQGAPWATQGMGLLQKRVQQTRVVVDTEEDLSDDEGGHLDDCGCRIGVEGWSSTRGHCSMYSRTSSEEAAWCRSRRSTPAPAPPASGAGDESGTDDCGCRVGQEGWSSTRNRCAPDSQTSPQEAARCREKAGGSHAVEPPPAPTPVAAPVAAPAPPLASGPVRTLKLMTWNVYFGNSKYSAMADMFGRHQPDIVNLQETNNRLDKIAKSTDYVSANSWKQSHDWCGYNFHRSDWSHEWSTEIDVPGSRGVCGAMIRKGETRLCVWGLHPVQRNNNVKYSQESIRLAADEMKSCSSRFNAPSVFMGDFNTADWRGAQWQLEQSTGWGWTLAAKNHIDFIFIQNRPLSLGRVVNAQVVGWGCVPDFPGKNIVTPSCGYSDHNPVYVEISVR